MDFQAARFSMVENQIRTNGVRDAAVCAALMATPREVFLPRASQVRAYLDDDVALGGGRFLMRPLVVARLLEAAAINPANVALVIGDSSGWLAAVLSRLASTVVSVDGDGEGSGRVGTLLSQLGCDSVAVVRGRLAEAYPAQAPYDVIVYAGAVAGVPAGVQRQLADGGRLVGVVRDREGVPGIGIRIIRSGDTFGRRTLFDASTPYLPGLGPGAAFRF